MTPEIPSYRRIRMCVLPNGRGVFPLTITPLMTHFIVLLPQNQKCLINEDVKPTKVNNEDGMNETNDGSGLVCNSSIG